MRDIIELMDKYPDEMFALAVFIIIILYMIISIFKKGD